MEDVYDNIWQRKTEQGFVQHPIQCECRVCVASRLLGTGKRLLDVGCGNGFLASTAKFDEICGVDISEEALKLAREKGVRAMKANLNGDALRFEDSYFDSVTCLDVIEHVIDPCFLIKEMNRVLKINGILIISTPNIRYWAHLVFLVLLGRFPKTSGDREAWDGGHLHYFTYADVKGLLESHGFKVLGEYAVLGKNTFKDFRSPGIIIKAKKDRKL